MPRRCTIERCQSRSDKPEHRGVTFHSFPFDSKTREVWISNCKLAADKNITKSVAVCSRHFRRADFTAVKGGKYTLKQGSVPTIFPWGKIDHLRTDIESKSSETSKISNSTLEKSLETQEQVGSSDTTASSVGVKRPKSDDEISTKKNPRKVLKIDKDLKSSTNIKNTPKKESLNFVPGVVVEAQDFDGIWHMAKVDEVDNVEREVLLKFESKEGKSYNKGGTEEWIPMNSSRLRPYIDRNNKLEQSYVIGEKVMARWTGARKFPATISKIFDNGTYEVLFDDGFIKVVKTIHISKVRQTKATIAAASISPTSNEQPSDVLPTSAEVNETANTNTITQSSNAGKNSKSNKKMWALISKDSLNLDELNLPHIPEDGEWCCHWVNDQPIGKVGFLMVGDHKKPTVIVDDWRLPSGWIKHMYQRSNVLGKWDVILVSPQGKRFRSKSDLKQFIEEQGKSYNPDVYDFSIHRRRAKDINAYVYTKDYKPPPVVPKDAAYANVKPIEGGLPSSLITSPLRSNLLSPLTTVENEIQDKDVSTGKQPNRTVNEESTSSILKLEDGWVYVGGLKIQIVDNLFRCPDESCRKNFRKENHLQIHVKHYHNELAKMLGVCPNMQELALKRTIGEQIEDLPKNHLPNAQFFAKVHQQEIQAKSQRTQKTSTTVPIVSQNLASPVPTSYQQNLDNIPLLPPETLTSESTADDCVDIKATSDMQEINIADQTLLHPTGDDYKEIEDKHIQMSNDVSVTTPISVSKSQSQSKSRKSSSRKSNRQRTTKKFLNTSLKSSSQLFDTTGNSSVSANLSPQLNDFEETRHSFNTTPEISKLSSTSLKKAKNLQSIISESFDGNSHTTSSFPDHSRSPQYVRENGELIKIVKMRQEEIINCLCSYTEEDGLMIQCELCLCWQHGICNGIEKEKQVPDKYVCVICRNPQRGRESLKYIHDQDWLYEGKLPVANYHACNPGEKERFEILKKSHTLTGNLLDTRRFLHSLKVKINIAGNKDHPKMYLWAKKWEDDISTKIENCKPNFIKDYEMKNEDEKLNVIKMDSDMIEEKIQPTIPQPEAPIEPAECQLRLLEHIKLQQQKVKDRLDSIEQQISEIEILESDQDMDDAKVREVLSLMIKDLTIMRTISKINTVPKTYPY